MVKAMMDYYQIRKYDAFDYPYLECKLKEFDKIREFAYNNK